MGVSAESRIIDLSGGYHVWTRRVGTGDVKVLLLHGGPGSSHEYLENFENHLPPAGVELYFYDQLGSFGSDQPDDKSLWSVDRFREEVEEVRKALSLDDFFLVGQSWGGMLGIEYALQYQRHLRGLVISNMTASIGSYLRYLHVLRNLLPAELVRTMESYEAKGDFSHPEYEEIVFGNLYRQHLCRLDPWPDAVVRGLSHINPQVYNTMQGPNEFVVTGNFKNWDRWDDLKKISVPTLLLGGRHDTMDPDDIVEMGRRIEGSRVAILENGSHLAMWDDEKAYFGHLLAFLKDIGQG